jgi:hypothetical protein
MPCLTGARIEVVVTDPTEAIVLGAEVTMLDGTRVVSDANAKTMHWAPILSPMSERIDGATPLL